ncbi:hypothetical protein GGD38_003639 [Chitinophagaceae bacterium OAS944]|nr:hypothetical protein [Chitinophagaceae bacterium OAS944]
MTLLLLLPIVLLLLSGWAATAISQAVHKNLVKAGNAHAKLFRVLIWFGSFILIAGVTIFLVINNIRIER